jgi:hypothetical protein
MRTFLAGVRRRRQRRVAGPSRLAQIALVLLAVALAMNACADSASTSQHAPATKAGASTSSGAHDGAGGDARPSAALVSGSSGLALVVDGAVVPVASEAVESYPAAQAAVVDDHRLAVAVGGTLFVLDAASGRVLARRDCGTCRGVGVDGEKVYTIQDDWTLLAYDLDLVQVSADPLPHQAEPPGDNPEPSPAYPSVAGVLDGRVVVVHWPPEAYRGGPQVVAFYGPDLTEQDRTVVDGNAYRAAVTPEGDAVLLEGEGSGGACYTSIDLTLVASDGTTAAVPLDTVDVGNQSLMVTSTQWFGSTLRIGALLTGNSDIGGDCLTEGLGYTWSRGGSLEPLDSRPAVVVGADCSVTLDTGDSYGDLTLTTPDGARSLDGYDSVVWVPPAPTRCLDEDPSAG